MVVGHVELHNKQQTRWDVGRPAKKKCACGIAYRLQGITHLAETRARARVAACRLAASSF
jgi:hypothetical protein